jgi:hypothetical protein
MNPDLNVHAAFNTAMDDDEADEIRELLSDWGVDVIFETAEVSSSQAISATTSGHEPGVEGAAGGRDARWAIMLYTRVNELAKRTGPAPLRETVEQLRALRAKQEGTSPADGLLMLVDEDTGIRLDLEFQLPLRAYEDLQTLSFRTFHADPLRFHRKTGPHGAWRGPH